MKLLSGLKWSRKKSKIKKALPSYEDRYKEELELKRLRGY